MDACEEMEGLQWAGKVKLLAVPVDQDVEIVAPISLRDLLERFKFDDA